MPVAAAQGYAPDCLVCTGDTPDGRPTPFMLYRAFLDLAVWPAWACVKVDDTEVGIAEGLNGGCWTVGRGGDRQRVRPVAGRHAGAHARATSQHRRAAAVAGFAAPARTT